MSQNQEIIQAAMNLASQKDFLKSQKMRVGFDGFVDEIIYAVDKRHNKKEYSRIQTLTEFGDRVKAAAGKSTNIELVPQQEKPGGNGPLMSMAAAGMGVQVTCIGMLGYPVLHPAFKPLEKMCQVLSIGNPGHTDALEFHDGKLMLGKIETMKDMCWNRLVEVLGEDGLHDLIQTSNMIACTNWTMLTEMDEVLENLIRLVPDGSPVQFFFDLADPEKRSRTDLAQVLELIKTLGKKAQVLLGLNLSEAEQVQGILGIAEPVIESVEGLAAASHGLQRRLGIHGIVVHGIKFAAATVGSETAGVGGPFCPHPKLSTGAGDHFNGGFCSGLLAKLSVADSLYAGVGTSGWYVRQGRSPGVDDVIGLLDAWGKGQPLD